MKMRRGEITMTGSSLEFEEANAISFGGLQKCRHPKTKTLFEN